MARLPSPDPSSGIATECGARATTLTVAVCTHKRPEGLRTLLAALRPQLDGRPGRDLVVVNDGSHDARYADVLADFGGVVRYEAIEENVGIAEARNRAAAMATGEFIVFTDDDCEPPDWWLDWLEESIAQAPEVDVIAGPTIPLLGERPTLLERVHARVGLLPGPA